MTTYNVYKTFHLLSPHPGNCASATSHPISASLSLPMNVLQMPSLDDPFDAALAPRHDARGLGAPTTGKVASTPAPPSDALQGA